MRNITQTEPAPEHTGTPAEKAVRTLVDWRHKDRAHIANKADRDAQRAEYRARQDLRGAADNLSEKAGQP
jgi:hypothetical protein